MNSLRFKGMQLCMGRCLLPCVLAAVLCFMVMCGSASAAGGTENQAEITADTIDYDESRGEVRLLGNVCIRYEDAVLTASYARYLTKQQEAVFQGQVKLEHGSTVLTGRHMTAWFAKGRVQMQGQALITDQRPDSSGVPHETRLSADSITYDWPEQLAQANGNVALDREGRRAYAASAEYDIRKRRAVMKGSVRFEQNRNEWLMSESIVIDLAAKKAEAQGRVSGRFVIEGSARKK
ncbi:hypothetical protein IJT17_08970, partial [bacterium]|nr:hypothetical protein [bacterium]